MLSPHSSSVLVDACEFAHIELAHIGGQWPGRVDFSHVSLLHTSMDKHSMCQMLLLHSEVRSTCPLVCDCHVLCAFCCLKVFVSQTPDVDQLSITQVRTHYLDTCARAITWKSILKRNFMYLKEKEERVIDFLSVG